MPVLPLFDTPADPNAWHRVTAPGGYERWHFDAEDEARRIRLVAIFVEGPDFDGQYLRRYHRYRRRPTRVPPPQAGEYPCVQFTVYEDHRVLDRFTTQHRPEEFIASSERPEVRIGPNGFHREPDGSLRVEIRQSLSADLVFQPLIKHAPYQRRVLARPTPGDEHHWVIAHALCRMEGSIRVEAAGAAGARVIPIAGRGYHDHHFGTGPIGLSALRCLRGRVLAEDRVFAFQLTRPASGEPIDEVVAVEGDAGGLREVPDPACAAEWGRRTKLGLAYPATLHFKDRMRLSNPRLVESSRFHLRLTYDAEVAGARSTAFCDIAYPRRLASGVLGRMMGLRSGL